MIHKVSLAAPTEWRCLSEIFKDSRELAKYNIQVKPIDALFALYGQPIHWEGHGGYVPEQLTIIKACQGVEHTINIEMFAPNGVDAWDVSVEYNGRLHGGYLTWPIKVFCGYPKVPEKVDKKLLDTLKVPL